MSISLEPNPFSQLGDSNPFYVPTTPRPPVRETYSAVNLNPATWNIPGYNPNAGSSGGGSTVQTVANTVTGQMKWDSVASLVSQLIAGYAKNPTTQVSGLTVQTVKPQSAYNGYGNSGLDRQQLLLAQQQQYLAELEKAKSPGAALGSGLDGIVNWATSNPIIVFAGIAGVYLLMREPPRGRR